MDVHTHTQYLSLSLPEEGLPGEPDVVLLDGLPGEEQEQQQHGDTEDCCAPTAHYRTQPTQAMSHQDTVTHARRGEGEGGFKGGWETKKVKVLFMIHELFLLLQSYILSVSLSSLNTPLQMGGHIFRHRWLLWLPIKTQHLYHIPWPGSHGKKKNSV